MWEAEYGFKDVTLEFMERARMQKLFFWICRFEEWGGVWGYPN